MAQGPDPWPNSRVSDQVADNFYKASSDAARSIAADKRPMLNGSDSPVGTAARHIICCFFIRRNSRREWLHRNRVERPRGNPIAPSVQEEKLRLVVETADRAWH
jgi:hypothetical protein